MKGKVRYGYDAINTYLEFNTPAGTVRLGFEGEKLYIWRKDHGSNPVKFYITNSENELASAIDSLQLNSSIAKMVGSSGIITIPTCKKVVLTADHIATMFTTPVVLVPAVAGVSYEFISAFIAYERRVASFTGGGDVTIRDADSVIMSNTVTAANCFNAATNAYRQLKALSAAGGYVATPNKAIRITNGTGVFVKGTAEGLGHITITYNAHVLGF